MSRRPTFNEFMFLWLGFAGLAFTTIALPVFVWALHVRYGISFEGRVAVVFGCAAVAWGWYIYSRMVRDFGRRRDALYGTSPAAVYCAARKDSADAAARQCETAPPAKLSPCANPHFEPVRLDPEWYLHAPPVMSFELLRVRDKDGKPLRVTKEMIESLGWDDQDSE